jgi:hypothetical protein
MRPQLIPGEFVFCTVSGTLADFIHLEPLASFAEAEGLTLILPKHQAEAAGLGFQGVFRQITLQVHSSLEAVGLTAAVSARLTEHNISANVVAAYHHDHIFVPASVAAQALAALTSLTEEATI